MSLISITTRATWTGGVAQTVEHLLWRHKTLSWKSQYRKKKILLSKSKTRAKELEIIPWPAMQVVYIEKVKYRTVGEVFLTDKMVRANEFIITLTSLQLPRSHL
jgi:hypothetical protein